MLQPVQEMVGLRDRPFWRGRVPHPVPLPHWPRVTQVGIFASLARQAQSSTSSKGSTEAATPRHPGAAQRSPGSRAAGEPRSCTDGVSGFRARPRRPGMTAQVTGMARRALGDRSSNLCSAEPARERGPAMHPETTDAQQKSRPKPGGLISTRAAEALEKISSGGGRRGERGADGRSPRRRRSPCPRGPRAANRP
jgi:hypothetical protein